MSDSKLKNIGGATDLRVSQLTLGPDSAVARIVGTLDATTAADLETRLQSILESLPKNFLLDLGAVDYLSSMGVSVLLKTSIRLKNSGSVCMFYDPQLSVRRVLQISKWDHLILNPASLTADSPFFGYVCDEEPGRAARRSKATSNPPRLFED